MPFYLKKRITKENIMKMIKTAFVGFVLFASSLANAGLIDLTPSESAYTTVNGLDWLDWSATDNMSNSSALSAYSGWRLATVAEAKSLMSLAFANVVYDSENIARLNGSYSSNFNAFASLFGITCTTCGNTGVYAQVSGIGLVGTRYLNSNSIYAFNGYLSSKYNGNIAQHHAGIALVRSATLASVEVPEPSTFAIFALGIMGLASRRFKK
jgi:hypothetical protein